MDLRCTRPAVAALIFAIGLARAGAVEQPAPLTDAPNRPPAPYALTVELGKPVVSPEGELTVELLGVRDHRCAVEVLCIWAGHAVVTLRVSKPGSDARTLLLDTLAPLSTSSPLAATYGAYRFALVGLAPGNSLTRPVPQSFYRARVQVSQL